MDRLGGRFEVLAMKVSFGSCRIQAETLDGQLQYDIVVDEIKRGDNSVLCEEYGLCVALRSGEALSREEIHGLTTSREAIEELLARLMRHNVTPISVRDIVEDCLAELTLT
jgi:hypothetical protein